MSCPIYPILNSKAWYLIKTCITVTCQQTVQWLPQDASLWGFSQHFDTSAARHVEFAVMIAG